MPQATMAGAEAAPTLVAPVRLDRRTLRSREQLRDALAAEVQATGDLARVTVTGLTERAGLTRRTFYSHFHDIPDLVDAVERAVDEHAALAEQALAQEAPAER